MIWNNQVLFLHVPKTGGMSVTEFLLENLQGPVNYSAEVKKKGLSRKAKFHEGQRHETLVDAESFFTYRNRSIFDFEAIFAVMRNPYDLEVSRYHYLRQGHKVDRGPAQELAMAGDYAAYLREAAFFGAFPPRLDRFFQFGDAMPPNLRILRYEQLEQDLRSQMRPYLSRARAELPRLNASARDSWSTYYDAETAELCERRHGWFFDKAFYPRWSVMEATAPTPEAVPEPEPVPDPAPEPHFPDELPAELFEREGGMGAKVLGRQATLAFERLNEGLGTTALRDRRVLDVGCGPALARKIVGGRRAVGTYVGLDTDPAVADFLRTNVHHPHCSFGALAIDGGFVTAGLEREAGADASGPFDTIWSSTLTQELEPDDLVALLRLCRRQAADDCTLVANVNLLERSAAGSGLFDWLVSLGLPDDAADDDMLGPTERGQVLYSRSRLGELLAHGGWEIREILDPATGHPHTVVCHPQR